MSDFFVWLVTSQHEQSCWRTQTYFGFALLLIVVCVNVVDSQV